MSDTVYCPYCKSRNASTTVKGKMTNAATFSAGYVTGYAVNSLINSILPFDVHTTGKIAKGIRSFIPIEYECKSCDCLFSVKFDSTRQIESVDITKFPVPYEIIQREKDTYIANLESNPYSTLAVISGLLCIGAFIYCCFTDSTYQVWREASWFHSAGFVEETHPIWLSVAILCGLSGIIAAFFTCFSISNKEEIKKIKDLPLINFKRMYPEVFEKYPQYR